MSRYRFVSTMKAEGFPVDAACEAAEVSTSAYYEWLQRAAGPTAAELDEAYLVNHIRDIHTDSDATYGSPRVTGELRRRGYCVNHKRTERLMAENAIVGVTPRRRTPRTTMAAEGAPPLPDLVNQDFAPGEPDRRWAGDITYIGTDEGWLYLASVLDLGSRRLVGWAMDETMPTGLVAEALRRATELRGGDITGVIFHSDRGSQGGFNRSSQHLMMMEVWSGSSTASRRPSEATEDAIARSPTPASGDPAPVLDRDRHGTDPRRSCFCSRRFAAGRSTLVPQCWRHGTLRSSAAERPLPVVRGARGDRDLAGQGSRRARDCTKHRTGSIDDLSRAAAQRSDPCRQRWLPSIGGPMEGRDGCEATEALEAGHEPSSARVCRGATLGTDLPT